MDHRAFVSALPLLLTPSETIVFSTYEPKPSLVRFFSEHELTPDDFVLGERQRCAIYHEDNPRANAWLIRAEPNILLRLGTLLNEIEDTVEFCSHIAAYCGRLPVFVFHDAFESDPMYVSTRVAEARVAAFAEALGKRYCTSVFAQVEIAPETRSAMNRVHVGMSESEAIALMEPVTFGCFKNESVIPGVRELSFTVAILQYFSVQVGQDGEITTIMGIHPPERGKP